MFLYIQMANLQNFRRPQDTTLLTHVGQKVKQAAEIAGTVKGIWDIGRSIYTGFQVAAPYIEAAMLVGL